MHELVVMEVYIMCLMQDGCVPMTVARQLGHRSVITLLIINDPTFYRVRLPPLHIAADRDDARTASLLLHSTTTKVLLAH